MAWVLKHSMLSIEHGGQSEWSRVNEGKIHRNQIRKAMGEVEGVRAMLAL